MTLQYPTLANSPRVQQAAANKKNPLGMGEKSEGVRALQLTLADTGIKLPISFSAKVDPPDGVYGKETRSAIVDFQRAHELDDDGMAGPDTLAMLDKIVRRTKREPPPPIPPPEPWPPKPKPTDIYKYKVGTVKPPIPRDPGAGTYNSEPATIEMRAKKRAILQALPASNVIIGVDAVKHMDHYFSSMGTRLQVPFKRLIAEVKRAKEFFELAKTDAKFFVQSLPNGVHDIVSKFTQVAGCPEEESRNWFFAVGGYHAWGRGHASSNGLNNGARSYRLEFDYFFEDRYNWDTGKEVNIGGVQITDKFMGTFHRQGLAQEYNLEGATHEILEWKHGDF